MTEQAPSLSDTLSPPPDFRRWLVDLSRDAGRAIGAVRRVAAQLEAAGSASPTELFETLELARAVQLPALEQWLRHVQTAVFPLTESSAGKLRRALAELRAAAAAYRRSHEACLAEDSRMAGPPVAVAGAPGGAEFPTESVALARALDMQARLLQLQMLHRVDIPAEHWSELVDLAGLLRASRSPDLPVPDATPLFKQATARGLFVYPLLLLTADLTRRLPAEADLIDRLAQSWAGKVGYRVDPDGRLQDNPHGPTVQIGIHRAVRLDTHRVQRRLVDRIALVAGAKQAQELRLPRGLSQEHMLRVLRDIAGTWSAEYQAQRWPLGLLERVTLRFGLPVVSEPIGPDRSFDGFDLVQRFSLPSAAVPAPVPGSDDASPLAAGAPGPAPSGPEQAGLLPGPDAEIPGRGTSPAAVIGGFDLEGEEAWWVGRADLLWSVERQSLAPIKGGELVTLQAVRARTPVRRLGWVERLLQGGGRERVELAEGEEANDSPALTPRYQRIGLRMWPGAVEVVSMRMAGTTFYEEVLQLRATEDMPSCVVLPPGRWRSGGPATLRLPLHERSVEFVRVWHRGPGYEVVETRLRDLEG